MGSVSNTRWRAVLDLVGNRLGDWLISFSSMREISPRVVGLWKLTPINPVGIGDNQAGLGLAKYLCQPHTGDYLRGQHVAERLAGSTGGSWSASPP